MRRGHRLLVFAGAWLCQALLAGAAAAGDAGPVSARFERQGVVVAAEVGLLAAAEAPSAAPLVEGRHARVTLRVSDLHTGRPLGGLYPGAWLDRVQEPGGLAADEDGCREKVESFIAGSIFARPAVDLNVYYVLALNDDATITVVDPLFGFGSTQLLDLVRLRGPGGDWALDDRGQRLFVSLPDWDRVTVVETATWDVALEIDTGPRPDRVALSPDGRRLWVAYDDGEGRSGVTVIDTRGLSAVADLAAGAGPHDIAFSDDGRFAFVANRGAGTVTVLDAIALAPLREVPAGRQPLSVAWSSAAAAAYVSAADGTVTVIDPERAAPVAALALGAGLGRLAFAPGGRLAFVAHPASDEVHLLDASRNRVVQTAAVEDQPDRVAFSDELAFVRHRGSSLVLMIPLDQVGEAGRPVPVVDFPGGEHAPGQTPLATPAAGIVQAPGAAAVLVANPLDRAIYYYKEGMAAPMGHFKNYGHVPRAVMVVDRSLEETAPGVYQTTIELPRAGLYELVTFLDAPRRFDCLAVRVAEDPALARRRMERPAAATLLTPHREVKVGEEARVRFRLTASADGRPIDDARDAVALVFPSPGLVQWRHPAVALGDGVYEVRFTPGESGVWYVYLAVPSLELALHDSPPQVLAATARVAAGQPPG